MSSIHLICFNCANCGKDCWVNNGDINDLTMNDIEGFKCWSCCCNNYIHCEEGLIDIDIDIDMEESYMTPQEAI